VRAAELNSLRREVSAEHSLRREVEAVTQDAVREVAQPGRLDPAESWTQASLSSELRRLQSLVNDGCERNKLPWPGWSDCSENDEMMGLLRSNPWLHREGRSFVGCDSASCVEAKLRIKAGPWTFWANDNLDFLMFQLLYGWDLAPPSDLEEDRRKKRLVVEFGASEGLSASNSLFFEQVLGWSSILMEPTSCFERLQFNRPAATSVRAALCDAPKLVSLPTAGTWCGKEVLKLEPGALLGGPYVVNPESGMLEMECTTLASIFATRGVTHVDLMFVDMEGFEIEALRGIDFDAVSVDFLVVEKRTKDIQEKIDFMAAKGYGYVEIGRRDMLFFAE